MALSYLQQFYLQLQEPFVGKPLNNWKNELVKVLAPWAIYFAE